MSRPMQVNLEEEREQIARIIDEMVSGPTFGKGEIVLREAHRNDQLAAAAAILAFLTKPQEPTL